MPKIKINFKNYAGEKTPGLKLCYNDTSSNGVGVCNVYSKAFSVEPVNNDQDARVVNFDTGDDNISKLYLSYSDTTGKEYSVLVEANGDREAFVYIFDLVDTDGSVVSYSDGLDTGVAWAVYGNKYTDASAIEVEDDATVVAFHTQTEDYWVARGMTNVPLPEGSSGKDPTKPAGNPDDKDDDDDSGWSWWVWAIVIAVVVIVILIVAGVIYLAVGKSGSKDTVPVASMPVTSPDTLDATYTAQVFG